MENKFTPGKWDILSVGNTQFQITAPPQSAAYENSAEVCIAIVDSWDGEPDHEQIEFNARLIAAAPEMLEALERYIVLIAEFKTLSDVYDKRKLVDALLHHNEVRKLIKKARGENA